MPDNSRLAGGGILVVDLLILKVFMVVTVAMSMVLVAVMLVGVLGMGRRERSRSLSPAARPVSCTEN